MAIETWDGRAPRRVAGTKDPGNVDAFVRFLAYSDDTDAPPAPLTLRVRDIVRVHEHSEIPGASVVVLSTGEDDHAIVHGTVDEVTRQLAPVDRQHEPRGHAHKPWASQAAVDKCK